MKKMEKSENRPRMYQVCPACGIIKDERAEAYLTIDDPKDKCPFVQEVQKGLKEK